MLYLIWESLIKVGDLYRLIYGIFCFLYALFILYRAYFASKVDFFICKTEILKKIWKKSSLFLSRLGSHGIPSVHAMRMIACSRMLPMGNDVIQAGR